MKKIYLKTFSVIFLAGITFFLPQLSGAFSVTYLDPTYTASPFLTIPYTNTMNAIEFDDIMNLYTARVLPGALPDDPLTARIRMLPPPYLSDLSTSSIFIEYSPTGPAITGLSFDKAGNLLVSENVTGGNSGTIRIIDTNTKLVTDTISLDVRPTGITNDLEGTIYFPGRWETSPNDGNIYQIDIDGTIPTVLVSAFVGTGIAYYSGNLFVSTPYGIVDSYVDNSIYKINMETLTPTLFATFDKTVDELTFDKNGNLYVLDSKTTGVAQTIIEISPVPEPTTMLLLGSGLIGLIGFRKKFKK